MSYVLHIYRMTYKTYDMQEYIFVHPEEWYSMSPILRDLFVSSFGHSEKRVKFSFSFFYISIYPRYGILELTTSILFMS